MPLLISGVIWGIVHILDPATPSACSYILTMSTHVATDSVTMTRSLICIHAPQIANDYVIVTIPFYSVYLLFLK